MLPREENQVDGVDAATGARPSRIEGGRPRTVTQRITRALGRDRDLPLSALAAKGLRFGMAMATAPVYLRDCDTIGSGCRTIGRPVIQNFGRLTIGSGAIMNSKPTPVRLSTSPRGSIQIGDHFIFNFGASIASDARIRLGDRVTLGPYAQICDFQGGGGPEPAEVVLEADVWLTIRVQVQKGVRIGSGTIVTAGSVVTSDLPANVIAGGVPARPLKPRPRPASASAEGRRSASLAQVLVREGSRALDAGIGWIRLLGVDSLGREPFVRGHALVQNFGTICVGQRFRLHSYPEESHLVTGPRGRLTIGDDVTIGAGAAITADDAVRIGDRVTLGNLVMIMDTNFHGTDDFMAASATSPVIVEDDVRVGAGVTILKGTTIGRGATIAPGSVVSGTIPPGAVAAGVLAKVVSPPSS
ncbi:MAG: acyltransferase [Myxococcales bacterium]|nr:acyltransferase [Myxococcales bacterium]